MRTSREDTIRQYAEEYLAGRSDEQRQEFFSKPIARQYSNIMAWRRRNDKRQAVQEPEALSVAAVIKHAPGAASSYRLDRHHVGSRDAGDAGGYRCHQADSK